MAVSDPTQFLKPPRLPRRSPVTVLHLRADNDVNGNPRRAFAVLTTTGRTVEVIDEGYAGEAQVWARWPWFHHSAASRLGLEPAYARGMDVSVTEYRHWLKATPDVDSPELLRLRGLAERYAKFSAIVEALGDIRRHGSTELPATVYHRHPDDGGDAVSEHLRRALGSMVKAGMIERVDHPAEPGTRAFFSRSVGQYRPTDSTPRVA